MAITGLGEQPVNTPGYGCLWPVDSSCFDTDWTALNPDLKKRSIALAGETLRRLTGYRVGGCPVTVRPCSGGCAMAMSPNDYYGSSFHPHMNVDGQWVNSCGHRDCSCTVANSINLPAPVGAVYEVKANGTVVPPSDWRLVGNKIIFTGSGSAPWPVWQDISLGDDQPGTSSVTFLNAYPVDGLGAYACAVLAMEYAKACSGTKCRLPASVTSVTRQGLSFQIPTGAFPDGLTGIREVDAFIALWNPQGLRQMPKVFVP